MRALRGNEVAMIFQEPMTSLNPVFTIGEQIAESLRLHKGLDRAAAWRRRCACSSWWRFPRPRSACTSIRTSSRAACASA